jgi:hypothetical protein
VRQASAPEPLVALGQCYDGSVTPLTRKNLLAFRQRAWTVARRSKDESISGWSRRQGATATFRLSQALLDQIWPQVLRDKRRGQNVAGLVQLTEKLRRARTTHR